MDHTNISAGRIAELSGEPIAIVPYSEEWPARYAAEEARLSAELPPDLCTRIAHIGSTAVPGLSAKPVVDIQVEVTDLDRVRREVVPRMEALGYEFIWRPTMGEKAPYYAWFIGRHPDGRRAFHVHMVEPDEATVDRLLFRDHLRAHPEVARQYEALKRGLASTHPADRAAYTRSKTPFIADVLRRARAGHP
ncbi:MAG: GrpB family protein [Flavobacteriales bacterium]|nr:GrpB family protein [Flavobacteriales bacterium]